MKLAFNGGSVFVQVLNYLQRVCLCSTVRTKTPLILVRNRRIVRILVKNLLCCTNEEQYSIFPPCNLNTFSPTQVLPRGGATCRTSEARWPSAGNALLRRPLSSSATAAVATTRGGYVQQYSSINFRRCTSLYPYDRFCGQNG